MKSGVSTVKITLLTKNSLPEDSPAIRGNQPHFFYGFIIVIVALFLDLITAGIHFTFGIFFTPLSHEFGWTRAAISGAFTFYSLSHGALYIVTGKLSDRYGPRPLLISSGLFLGLGLFLMSTISHLWQLYLYYFILAVGMSGSFVPLMSTIARWFDKWRGLMTGLVLAGGGLGQAVFPQIGTWLIAAFQWRNAYIILAVGVCILIIFGALFMYRDPSKKGLQPYGSGRQSVEHTKNPASTGMTFRQVAATHFFWMFCLAIIFAQFSIGMMVVHAVPHGQDLGLSSSAAAGVVTTFAGCGIAARVVFGAFVDRLGGRRVMMIACLVLAVTLLSLSVTRSIGWFYGISAVFGLGFGGFVSSLSPLTAQLFGLRSHGVILGVATFGAAIGGGLGPLLAGAIYDTTGKYTLAFLTVGLLSLSSFAIILFLKTPPSPVRDPA